MPIRGQGWELHVIRDHEEARGARRRTIGTYVVYHNGAAQPALSGTAVETKGPGSNIGSGNGRRIEAGTYPLLTQGGKHYVTIGYRITDDPDQTPKPGLDVGHTVDRVGILVHPGHDFIASVGCINLTSALANAQADIPFVDSRDRVVAVINDLAAFVGAAFPHYNGERIPGAFIVLDGEP